VDEGGDDEARADAHRGEHLGEGRSQPALRFPWLHTRPRTATGKRPLVSGRKPIEEECSADQDQDRRSPEGDKGPWPEVRARLNRLLTGWSAY
jgi:hypothetical protein